MKTQQNRSKRAKYSDIRGLGPGLVRAWCAFGPCLVGVKWVQVGVFPSV